MTVTKCVMGKGEMGECDGRGSSLCGKGDSNGVCRRRNMSDRVMGGSDGRYRVCEWEVKVM